MTLEILIMLAAVVVTAVVAYAIGRNRCPVVEVASTEPAASPDIIIIKPEHSEKLNEIADALDRIQNEVGSSECEVRIVLESAGVLPMIESIDKSAYAIREALKGPCAA